MIETNSQFMNRVEQRREQRQREMEAWVRQTTFADLRHPSPWNEYPKLLEQVQSGQTRAAIYALVGTKRQVNGNGLVRQVEKCLAEYVLRGFAVTEEDIYLEVGSGSDASRPVLKRLLSQCESKQYQVIVIEVADRWWQGFPGDAEPLYECLEAAGTRLVTYYGDPPESRTTTLSRWEEAQAASDSQAIERLLRYAESSGQPLESLAQLWIREGEEAVLQLVEPDREDVAAPHAV